MDDDLDQEIRRRLIRLENSLPMAIARAERRRRPAMGRWLLVAGAVLGLAVAAAAVTAENAPQEGVRGYDDVFMPGQPLACSDMRNMVPSEAAPRLEALGYHVTWQLEGFPSTRSYQTMTPPDEGHIFAGIAHGHELVLVVEYDQMSRGDLCGG